MRINGIFFSVWFGRRAIRMVLGARGREFGDQARVFLVRAHWAVNTGVLRGRAVIIGHSGGLQLPCQAAAPACFRRS